MLNKGMPLPVFEKVIRPMLNASNKAFIYLPKNGAQEDYDNSIALCLQVPSLMGSVAPAIIQALDLSTEDILVKERGKYRLDKTKDCITKHEYLWLANGYRRGSIIINLPRDFDFLSVLPHCYTPKELLNPILGQSPGAVKMCKEIKDNGGIAVIFSASNGLEFMDIYAPNEVINSILTNAHLSKDDM